MGKELETIESIRLSFEQWEQIIKELNKLPTLYMTKYVIQ